MVLTAHCGKDLLLLKRRKETPYGTVTITVLTYCSLKKNGKANTEHGAKAVASAPQNNLPHFLWSSHGNSKVWEELHNLVLWTETLTMIEVIHAQTGLVRASPATTALQVAGRNTIVWAITRNYPDVAAGQWAYSSMLVAWNVADSVRYTFFAIERGTGRVPNALLWLRYNMFFVLYPIGIVSEAWLAYSVITPSRSRNPAYQYLLWLGLTIYIPAFYILFGHMLAQRRKSLQKTAGKTA
ncbi:hypothetical protein V490_00745 [Pseudogymnoascus sp. VKM F-3557]|nr:hypothetical protein V490_00745 [Pseudogymnoascus sp. VKM F-3557]